MYNPNNAVNCLKLVKNVGVKRGPVVAGPANAAMLVLTPGIGPGTAISSI